MSSVVSGTARYGNRHLGLLITSYASWSRAESSNAVTKPTAEVPEVFRSTAQCAAALGNDAAGDTSTNLGTAMGVQRSVHRLWTVTTVGCVRGGRPNAAGRSGKVILRGSHRGIRRGRVQCREESWTQDMMRTNLRLLLFAKNGIAFSGQLYTGEL